MSIIHAQISVFGQVQGVGFRPFVYHLAQELGIAGWVRNDSEGVKIVVEGAQLQVMSLIERLQSKPPGLARVKKVTYDLTPLITGLQGFKIMASTTGKARTDITPDMALCADCLAELFDPNNRRYRHPFINCIHCGPRYTLTARLPYDRLNTSMAQFVQCPACQEEYNAPTTRRFHAQPNACPACGPQLSLFDACWQAVASTDLITTTATRMQTGEVIAVKGVGGFHLMCDARNAASVARLRRGKYRDEKPFAVMVLNALSARHYAQLCVQEAELLEQSERPIVLLHKTANCDTALPGIAPGLPNIGLILPYTPLQYLLFHELLGKPPGTDWLKQAASLTLLITSANSCGEPLVKDDTEARISLSGLADFFLTHDRDILQRCDDSVMKWQGDAPSFIRRARGYTPRRIELPYSGPSVLACGASLKNTVCLTRDNEAFVSQHIGDLNHASTRQILDETVIHLCDILDIQPQVVAHDLHPDFYSTQLAQTYAAQHGLPILAVQHHHAHIAAICAEHHITEAVIGLALDGMGLGADGSAWGGELLHVDGINCQRIGNLAPLPMPGGDRAAREPWRMAAAVLYDLQRGEEIVRRYSAQSGAQTIHSMLQRQLNCTLTTSMGRYFDAASGLLGISEVQNHEGQAAMLLEGWANKNGAVMPLKNGYTITPDYILDFRPLLSTLADCKDMAYGAALFHATLTQGLIEWAQHAAERHHINYIALGGGCFMNTLLLQSVTKELSMHGLRVLRTQQLPANDGGISLGQAYIAMKAFAKMDSSARLPNDSSKNIHLKHL